MNQSDFELSSIDDLPLSNLGLSDMSMSNLSLDERSLNTPPNINAQAKGKSSGSIWQSDWFIARYKATSLVEMYLLIVMLILSLSMQNWYLLIVLFALLTKHLPEQLFKRIFQEGWFFEKGKAPVFSTRPPGATNCNAFNAGGPSTTPGAISGHVFILTSFTCFVLYTFTGMFSRRLNSKQAVLISFLFIIIAMLAVSRVQLNCHRPIQTVIGFVGGFVWGLVIYYIVEAFVNGYDEIYNDKMKLMQLFEVADDGSDGYSPSDSSSSSGQSTGTGWNSL